MKSIFAFSLFSQLLIPLRSSHLPMHVIAMTVKVYIVMKYKRKGGIPAFIFRKWKVEWQNGETLMFSFFRWSSMMFGLLAIRCQMPSLAQTQRQIQVWQELLSDLSLRPGVSDLSAGEPGSDDIRSALQKTRWVPTHPYNGWAFFWQFFLAFGEKNLCYFAHLRPIFGDKVGAVPSN